MSSIIYLPRDLRTIVSRDDYEELSQYKWSVNHDGKGKYYVCRYAKIAGKHRRIYMHRQITGCIEGLVVDHIDGDTFNNTRNNLRTCTQKMNQLNCVPWGAIPYRGVSKTKANTYRARIKVEDYGSEIYLGTFKTPEEAARAYDVAAREHFGEFAYQNFMARHRDKPVQIEEDIPF